MKAAKMRAIKGYKRRASFGGSSVNFTAPHTLNCQFNVNYPSKVWVTDFTYSVHASKLAVPDCSH